MILLGLRHGLEAKDQGLPEIVYKGQDLLRRFAACHGTTSCREIRRHARVPLRCIGVVRQAPALCAQTICSDCTGSISDEQKLAYGRLYSHWVDKQFHCAHAVFHHLGHPVPPTQELLRGTSGLMGGTVFTGMTCSALTAGVMALGLALGEIENSRLRVLRMIGMMAIGGEALADNVNAFNRTINLGHGLSQWFAAEFGSTQCRVITQCDFSTTEGVGRYIEGGGTARCSAIAQSVAHRVQGMVQSVHAAGSVQRRVTTTARAAPPVP